MTEVLEEEEILESRRREVEGRLAEQQNTLEELQRELSHKGVLVGALRVSLKEKERSFLEDLKRHSHRTTVLTTELQKQTEAAAYLSLQLHSARKKLKHQQQHQQQHYHHHHRQRASHQDPQDPMGSPSPGPSGASPKPKRRSGGGKHSTAHIRAERARECVPREKVTGPEEPKAMPDPALFFYPHRYRARSRHAHRLPLEDREGLVDAEAPDRVAPILAAPAATATIAAESKAE